MKNNRITTKALSMFLTVIMLFTTISVGIIVPDAKVEANAAEVTRICKDYDQIRAAINYANSNPSDIVTIRLGADITNDKGDGGGAVNKFAAITGNVIIDLYGADLAFIHSRKASYTSQQFGVQLPSENAVNNAWHTDSDTVANSMFEVAESGTLQIINTSNANAKMLVNTTLESTAYKDGNNSHQTSSSLIRCQGTLILGDKENSLNNNFTLHSYSAVLNSSTDGGWNAGGSHNGANASSFAVTVDGDNAVFKMYGGSIEAAGDIEFRREATSYLVAIALNVKNCKSAEIYGGSIGIPNFSIKNNMDWTNQNANSGNRYIATAIRCSTPYLYIFDVESTVKASSGTETDDNDNLYIYLTNINSIASDKQDNSVHIYGGDFNYEGKREDTNNTALIQGAVILGDYKIASGGVINPVSASGANYEVNTCNEKSTLSKETSVYTVFVGDNGVVRDESNKIKVTDMPAENGIDMFSYNTFREYLAQHTATSDVYFGDEIMSTNGTFSGNANSTLEVGSTKYLRNGYTHTSWAGKIHPGAAYTLDCKTPAAAGLTTDGGSLFLVPVWEENVYEITYDWNDSDSSIKVTNTSDCDATYDGKVSYYTITSDRDFGIPVRPGYEFLGWSIEEVEYPSTDTKKNTWDILSIWQGDRSFEGKRNGDVSVQAIWEVIPCEATINLNGGNISGDTSDKVYSYSVNRSFRFPTGVVKDYYSFDGYYKVTKADGSWAADDTLYAAGNTSPAGAYGSPTLTAQFTPIEYTVIYDSMNGSSVDDENAKKYTVESTHSLPAVSRLGYNFAGWKPESSVGSWSSDVVYPAGTSFNGKHGDVYDADIPVTLEAQWTSSEYKLTLDLDNGSIEDNKTEYVYAYALPLEIKDPERAGYSFVEWVVSSTPAGTDTWIKGEEFKYGTTDNSVTIPANRMGDVTLKAVWEPNTYTVSFDANGGNGVTPFTYEITGSFTIPSTTKKGYTFTGWSVSEKDTDGCNWNKEIYNGGETVSGLYGNVTLRANWEKTNYVITLDANGGNVSPATLGYNFESKVDLPEPSKTGYSFTGWKVTKIDPSASWTLETVYTESLPAGQNGNMTLTAQWKHSEYNIHFVSSGSTTSDLKYYIDSEAFNVPASSYPGYEFLYWNVTTPAGNWEMNEKVYVDTDISGKYGNVTLNANFKAIPYTIIYKDIDGTTETVNYDMNTAVTLKNYERAGYTFSGWQVESVTDGAGWAGTYQPGEYTAGERYGNVVLTPVLTATEYEITFIPDGGTPYANLAYTIESSDTLPADAEKTGYDFAGWKVTLAGGNWTDGEIISAGSAVTGKYGDVTLTAQWTPKKYKITWLNDDDSVIDETYVEYNTVPSYANPTKAPSAQYTYTFAGWTPALTAVKGEATYKAQYSKTVNSYTVTWIYETDESGVKNTESSQYSYGVHPVFNDGTNPVKTSSSGKYYRFIGWAEADAQGNATDTFLSPDSYVVRDVTYVAVFKEIAAPRTVTWVINGVKQETKWEVGETPVYVGTPIKPDVNGMKYTFTGWTPAIVEVAADTDYTYTAQFSESAQTYTAEFDLNGGEYAGSTEVSYNKTAGLNMPRPEKAGYDFAGWRVVSNGGTWTQTELLTFSEYRGHWGDVSFKAEYTAKEYVITVEATDGTTSEYKYTIESTDTLPGFEDEGLVLTGWMIVSAEGNWTMGDTVAPDKLLTGMYGDIIIHPLLTAKLYKINWVSGDVTQTVEFKFGETVITYPPMKKAGYTASWDKEVPVVMPAEDLTFTAVYTPIQYYLRFNSAGGSAVENFYYDITSDRTLPTPERDGATFLGWKVSAGTGNWDKTTVYKGGTSLEGFYGNMTLTAVWQIKLHTVTWIAGDITKVTQWYHGATPSFDGTPYKSSDESRSYVFIGWDKEIVTVTEDVTYTALFDATERLYLIKWNVDGHIAEEKYYKYGETPVFNGLTPTRPSTSEFDFTFAGWTPAVDKVTGDLTYIALFDVFTKLQGLRVDKSAVYLEAGGEAVLTAILSPSTATVKDVEWHSSDVSVATVDANGKITAVGAGETIIRVQSKDGSFKAYCLINVAPIITTTVKISANGVSTTQLPGTSIQLYATVTPETATNRNVTWSSADTTIAMVDASGLVTFGEVLGTTVITAVADGYAVGRIEVTTTNKESETVGNVRTYAVMFAKSTSQYIVDGKTYESLNVIYPEGATIEFTLTEPHFVTLNGHRFERDTDGVFRIRNLDQNYTVISTERADLGFEGDPDTKPSTPSFFDRIKEFFRSIIEFFRNLFG